MKRRTFFLSVASAGLLVALTFTPVRPASATVSEAQVKAAYLYKLASFVRWPPSAFVDAAAPLRICIAGRDDVFGIVGVLSRDQAAWGRKLTAEAIDPAHPDSAAHCQILFVGRGEATGRALLAEAAQRPILTVTDRNAGTHGGIIEFILTDGNVRFTIHRHEAEARQLMLSSKLLAVAQSVEQ